MRRATGSDDPTARATTRFVLSGLGAGVAMGLYLGVAAAAGGQGFHAPFLMIGRTLDPSRLPFEMGPGLFTALGVLLHLVTAVFWALRYRVLAEMLPSVARSVPLALVIGPIWGTAIWLLMGLILGPTLNPRLRVEYPLHYYLAHLVYGCATALLLLVLTRCTRPTGRGRPIPVLRDVT